MRGLVCSMLHPCSRASCTTWLSFALILQMGVKSGEVAAALVPKKRLPSIGTCFNVGVAGFALQGGLGFVLRYHGVAADFIQSIDVVTVG